MNSLATLLLLLSLLAAEGKPTPKVPLGKDTTYVTGPLDKQGYVDYETALNDRLGKGITPAKNANVLLWTALGPTSDEDGKGLPAEYFKRLGMNEPPKDGPYFVGMTAYMKEHLKLERSKYDAIWDQQGRAGQRPWTAKDYPHIAGWLKINEKPLAVVVEATKRPDYYNPLVTHPTKKGPGLLIGALLPSVQKCRELASALTCRAMLRVAEEQFDKAWQDLLACHRLARLVGRGATLIEALVGIALDAVASNADLAYLERAKRTRKQIQDCLKDLQALKPMPPVADKIALAERFTFLDSVQFLRRGGIGAMEVLAGGEIPKKPNADEEQALSMIDWSPAFRTANKWYDRMAAALSLEDRADRKKALDRIEVDLKALKEETSRPEHVAKLLPVFWENPPSKTIGKAFGNVLVVTLMPAAGKVQDSHDRSTQIQRNLHVAFALGACQRDHGRYPAKLEELAPKYLASVPGDIFSDKALIYRPSEKGYLLYSVGVNGKDEGGRWHDDVPPGDDLGVRMPLPDLKEKK